MLFPPRKRVLTTKVVEAVQDTLTEAEATMVDTAELTEAAMADAAIGMVVTVATVVTIVTTMAIAIGTRMAGFSSIQAVQVSTSYCELA